MTRRQFIGKAPKPPQRETPARKRKKQHDRFFAMQMLAASLMIPPTPR